MKIPKTIGTTISCARIFSGTCKITAKLAILCCLAFPIYGQQNLFFQNLDEEDGLPGNLVSAICQDHKGFIWFGLWGHGLYRYDGTAFLPYQYQDSSDTSLSNNWPNVIFQDSDKDLWIGTWNGLNLYQRKLDNFKRFFSYPTSPSTVEEYIIKAIYEDTKGRIWVGHDGIKRIQKRDNSFSITPFTHSGLNPVSLSSKTVVAIFEDRDNHVWVVCDNGLNLFNENSNTFNRYELPEAISKQISTAIIDYSGQIWVGTNGQGLWRFDPKTGEYFDYWKKVTVIGEHLEQINTIYRLYEDSEGNLWILTEGSGLLLLDRSSNQAQVYIKDPLIAGSLPDNNLKTVYEEKSGDLWFGTGSGVAHLDKRRNTFIRSYHHPNRLNSLSDNRVKSITQDHVGNYWIATDGGGINHYDVQRMKFTHFKHQPSNANSLANNKVIFIMRGSDGWMWSGHWGGGITKFHPQQRKYIRYSPGSPESPFLSGYHVRKILTDSENRYWIVTEKGVDFCDSQLNRILHFPFDMAYDLLQDRTGKLWVGGHSGLYVINPESLKSRHVLGTSILSIYEDKSGTLWLSTLQDGLIKYQPGLNKTSRVKQDHIGNKCHGVIEDDQGYLWIGSTEGIFKYRPLVDDITKMGDFEGSESIYFKPYLKSYDGNIHFGGTQGLISFNPQQLTDTLSLATAPVLTDFQLFNKPVPIGPKSVLNESIAEASRIVLNHKQTVFTIGYVSTNFDPSDEIIYTFKLEGFDEEWREVGTIRNATYTNLNAGTYKFKVRAARKNTRWNPQEASIEITVLPAPWNTWWAYTLYGLLALIIVYFGRRQVIQRERLKNEMRIEHLELERVRELDHLKSQFLANVSHEFRTPLTLILGPLKQMYNETFKGDKHRMLGIMMRNSQRLLNLVNQLLDYSKVEAGAEKLEVSALDLVKFSHRLFAVFEPLAKERGMEYIFQSEINSLEALFDVNKLELVLYNLLSNAFKFTPDGGTVILKIAQITYDVESKPKDMNHDAVEIKVIDNGKGIAEKVLPHIFDRFYRGDHSDAVRGQGTGIGLTLAREYVELHQGSLSVNSQLGRGTEFTMYLPLRNERSSSDPKSQVDLKLPHFMDQSMMIPKNGLKERFVEDEEIPMLLLVEDHQDMQFYLYEILSDHFHILIANDGKEGFQQAIKYLPDIIVSDVMMPEMDGHELCKKLKTDERSSHIPVVILTARADEGSKLKGLETGADDYIAKPFNPLELQIRTQNLVDSRMKLREKFSLTLEPQDIEVTHTDQKFIRRALEILEQNRTNTNFNAESLVKAVSMSRSQLHRKLKALTGLSTVEFIRTYRINYAKRLIEKGYGNISEVAYESGFNTPSYFAICFKKQIGMSPSDYARSRS